MWRNSFFKQAASATGGGKRSATAGGAGAVSQSRADYNLLSFPEFNAVYL